MQLAKSVVDASLWIKGDLIWNGAWIAKSEKVCPMEAQAWFILYLTILNGEYDYLTQERSNAMQSLNIVMQTTRGKEVLSQIPLLKGIWERTATIALKECIQAMQIEELDDLWVQMDDPTYYGTLWHTSLYTWDDIKAFIDGNLKTCGDYSSVMSSTFDFSALVDKDRCAYCGQPATKTCGRCQSIVYCSRDCQSDDWKAHKLNCSHN